MIPVLLKGGQDLVALAQTGTGKTAAFGLPLIQLTDVDIRQPQAIILTPTRELCIQIARDLKSYSKFKPSVHIVPVYGGADMSLQIAALKKGAHIIVATPGRMNDLLNRRKKIDLSLLKTVVLDEADEMLNMGFKEELDAILEKCPETRTTLLFSATMPKEVLAISRNYMREPLEITVGTRNAGSEDVNHDCYIIHERDRYFAMKRIIDFNPSIYGIVFCKTRVQTKDIANKLIEDGYNADALHGDLSQNQREFVMNKFRIRNLQILVATDVAARGLDVKDLSHIINYNLPDDNPIYTHRSGRTGRAGNKGTSVAIINVKEQHKIKRIESLLKKKFSMRGVPTGAEICEAQLMKLVDKLQNIEINHKEIDKFLPAIAEKLEFMTREEIIKHFVSLEFNRFLDYYRDARDLSIVSERKVQPGRGSAPAERRGTSGAEEGFARIHINLGHVDGISPRDMIGLINRCTRKRYIEIGKIVFFKDYSYFEIDKRYKNTVLHSFRQVEFNGKNLRVAEAPPESQQAYSAHKKNRYADNPSGRDERPRKKGKIRKRRY
ncbi:MAG: DEAD/DEAH box helicase [Candidatus Cloacimonetes bacterium]|nr:DEAD/DEAH box helicase [Candidatus Cloacimonadota bacterium]